MSVIHAIAVNNAKMTIAILIISARIGLLRRTSMSHLLLLRSNTLQAQIFPGQACIEGVAISDLQKDIARAGIGPLLSHVGSQTCQDFPVGLCSGKWTQCFANSLDVVVNVGHTAIFFGEGYSG